MIKPELSYGRKRLTVRISKEAVQGTLLPKQGWKAGNEAALLRQALARPIGTPPLRDMVCPEQRVAIVTSDLMRHCLSWP